MICGRVHRPLSIPEPHLQSGAIAFLYTVDVLWRSPVCVFVTQDCGFLVVLMWMLFLCCLFSLSVFPSFFQKRNYVSSLCRARSVVSWQGTCLVC